MLQLQRLTRGFIVATLVGACTAAPALPRASASPTEQPIRGGRIVEALTTDVSTLQPLHAGNKAVSQLYEGLVRIDRTGAVVPNFGSWQVSADGRTYSCIIAADATWSDGTPITSSDFVVTIKAQARSKKEPTQTSLRCG